MLPIKARFIHNEDRLRGLISVLWSPWRAGESKCSLLVNTGSLLKHFTLVGSTVFESVPSSRSASRYFCSWLFALRFRSDWRGSLISLGWTAAYRILYFRVQSCVGFCHTSTWISHRYTHVPSLLTLPRTSHPIPLLYVGTECQIWALCIVTINSHPPLYFIYVNVYVLRRKWQCILVFLPGKSHRSGNLVGYSQWGCRVRHDLETKQQQCICFNTTLPICSILKTEVHICNGILLGHKKKAFESVPMRWMNLEPVVQSEVNQKEKNKYHILTHICGIYKNGTDEPTGREARE